MGISVEFAEPREAAPSKGSAGLSCHLGGCPTTVSALMEAGKNVDTVSGGGTAAYGETDAACRRAHGIVRKDIG